MKHINTGAQIIEVKINNHDLLYVSPLCDLNKKKSIRGGIPIIFPQFGENGYYKKHGFFLFFNFFVGIPYIIYFQKLNFEKKFFF